MECSVCGKRYLKTGYQDSSNLFVWCEECTNIFTSSTATTLLEIAKDILEQDLNNPRITEWLNIYKHMKKYLLITEYKGE